jgi:membrane-associated protease RseP (regulator of RpoE activity)
VDNIEQQKLISESNWLHPMTELQKNAARVQDPDLSRRKIILHTILFLITAVTTAMTGAALYVAPFIPANSIFDQLVKPHIFVYNSTMQGDFMPIAQGLLFTFTLLTILSAHEFGHYLACRYHGIRATLPFFIPAPPSITPFGTFGAVIKIREPIHSRRALFDIGIAGPLAGFVFALPAAFIGQLFAMEAQPPDPLLTGGYQYNDPILFMLIIEFFGLPKWIHWNPLYWASWTAILVTSLNLFPVGQLDGGHILYAVLGPRAHKHISRLVCFAIATLSVVSFFLYGSPIWFLWVVVLLFMLKVGHPPVYDGEALGRLRILLAIFALIVFILCFMPFPVTLY